MKHDAQLWVNHQYLLRLSFNVNMNLESLTAIETYPSHHVTEYDNEILHHVASDCHLLNIMVIDWQIILVSAVPQHIFGQNN